MKTRSVLRMLTATLLVFLGLTSTAHAVDYIHWFAWPAKTTYYRVGPYISAKGQAWVDATRKSSAKWSNHHSEDDTLYGVTPLTYDFYFDFEWYTGSGQQYDHTVSFANLDDQFLGYTFHVPTPFYGVPDSWYIRLNTDIEAQLTLDTNTPADRFDYWSLVLHEFGHVVALRHPGLFSDWQDPAVRPTMCSGLPLGDYSKRTLAQGDRDGVNYLYGPHN